MSWAIRALQPPASEGWWSFAAIRLDMPDLSFS